MSLDPPLPLLKPGSSVSKWRYKGSASSRGKSAEVVATIVQKPDKIKLAGTERETLLTVLTMDFRGAQIELKTWFEKGEGIIMQEQRNNGELIVAMKLLSTK